MINRRSIGALALAAALLGSIAGTKAHDEAKYPDWSTQWKRTAGTNWDPTMPRGLGQKAPLTPEYQAIYEANLKDQEAGGQGTDPTFTCIPDGMPRAMNVVFPMEIVILPKTHLYHDRISQHAAADLHRWPRLPEGFRAILYGLFDRQMDRPGRQWPL